MNAKIMITTEDFPVEVGVDGDIEGQSQNQIVPAGVTRTIHMNPNSVVSFRVVDQDAVDADPQASRTVRPGVGTATSGNTAGAAVNENGDDMKMPASGEPGGEGGGDAGGNAQEERKLDEEAAASGKGKGKKA